MILVGRFGAWAQRIKREVAAIVLAARHPRTPWYAKLLLAIIVSYALSPIDLIPDFIPVLGYLDDLVIVPAGIALAVRLIPPDVLDECRLRTELSSQLPHSVIGAVIVICLWLLSMGLCVWWLI